MPRFYINLAAIKQFKICWAFQKHQNFRRDNCNGILPFQVGSFFFFIETLIFATKNKFNGLKGEGNKGKNSVDSCEEINTLPR